MGKRIKDLSQGATEADLVSGNYLAIDGSAGTKKLSGNCIAPKGDGTSEIHNIGREETDGFLAVDNATNGKGKMNTSVIFNNFAKKAVADSINVVAEHLYIYNGVLYEAKENYTGSWDPSKFIKVNIDDVKRKYDNIISGTRNLFTSYFENGGIDGGTGADKPVAGQIRSGHVQISASTNYVVSCSSTSSAVRIYLFYYNAGTLVGSSSMYGFFPRTFTSPSGVDSVRFVFSAIDVSKFQLEEGSTATDYIKPYVVNYKDTDGIVVDLGNDGVKVRAGEDEQVVAKQKYIEDIAEFLYPKNIFSSEWSESGKGLNTSNGNEKDINNFRRTGFFAAKPLTEYTASCILAQAPTLYIFCYDTNKSFLGYVSASSGFYPLHFTTMADTAFVRLEHTQGDLPSQYQVEEGDTATAYEAYFEPSYFVKAGRVVGSTSITMDNKKWLFLGDSITAMHGGPTSWVDKFKVLCKANEQSYNQAVGGAKWCDDEPGIVYNGTPYVSQNFIGNQVEWVKNTDIVNVDIDAIIIAAGTNDDNANYPTDSDIEAAFYEEGSSTLISLENVDRSTWAGAIRYAVESLRALFPYAEIFIATPLQRMAIDQGVERGDMYPTILQKRETIEKISRRMSVKIIDTSECGICDTRSGMYTDGLHLSSAGATVLANFIYRKLLMELLNI